MRTLAGLGAATWQACGHTPFPVEVASVAVSSGASRLPHHSVRKLDLARLPPQHTRSCVLPGEKRPVGRRADRSKQAQGWGRLQAQPAGSTEDAAAHFALPLLGAVTGSAVACLEAFVLQGGPTSAVAARTRRVTGELFGSAGVRKLPRFHRGAQSLSDRGLERQAHATGGGAAQRPLRPLPGKSQKRARRRDPNTARWLMEALPSEPSGGVRMESVLVPVLLWSSMIRGCFGS